MNVKITKKYERHIFTRTSGERRECIKRRERKKNLHLNSRSDKKLFTQLTKTTKVEHTKRRKSLQLLPKTDNLNGQWKGQYQKLMQM